MKKIILFSAIWLSSTAFAIPVINVQDFLGHDVIVCQVSKRGILLQIQLAGPPSEWVVWFLGNARGAQKILSVDATPQEGMNAITEMKLNLERSTEITLFLNPNGNGNGSMTFRGNSYDLVNCLPKQ